MTSTLRDVPQERAADPINDHWKAFRSLLAAGWGVSVHPSHLGYTAFGTLVCDVTEKAAEVNADGSTPERAVIALARRCGVQVREPNITRAVEHLREALLSEVRAPRNGAGLLLSGVLAKVKAALRELGVEL